MKTKNIVFQETATVLAGQILCTGAMIALFVLLGKYTASVLLGGVAGAAIATANFFFMALFISIASDKAEAQDAAGGQKLIRLSYMGRMAGMFLILALCAKSGLFHVLALVLPLAFTGPILTIAECINKKGGSDT